MQTGKWLSQNIKLLKVKDHTTAGTDAVESDSVDMAQDGGFDGCLFLTSIGTAAVNNNIKVEQSAESSSGFAALEGSTVASGTNTRLAVDVYAASKRYLRGVVTRGTSTTCESIWAVLYRGKKVPTELAAATAIARLQVPAEA